MQHEVTIETLPVAVVSAMVPLMAIVGMIGGMLAGVRELVGIQRIWAYRYFHGSKQHGRQDSALYQCKDVREMCMLTALFTC